jgi:hypothetical protein
LCSRDGDDISKVSRLNRFRHAQSMFTDFYSTVSFPLLSTVFPMLFGTTLNEEKISEAEKESLANWAKVV